MTLATHSIVGLGLSSAFSLAPLPAFGLSLFSHYFLDMIPHWDYTPPFLIKDKENKFNHRLQTNPRLFYLSLLMCGADLLLGAVIGWLIFYSWSNLTPIVFISSIAASVLPDFLQGLYIKFPHVRMLIVIQNIHNFFHSRFEISNSILGIVYQILLVGIFTSIIFIIK